MLTDERISCVIARVDTARPGRLAIADIVADHRSGRAAERAVWTFARLPGCEIFLAPDGDRGYFAFARDGACFVIRTEDDGGVSAEAAEACAMVLYARSCAGYPASLIRTSSA